MALKDIVVHVDTSRACGSRMKVALDLARRHGAHLTGLYVMPGLKIPTYIEAEIGPDLLEAQQAAAKAAAERAEACFREVADKESVVLEWRCVEGSLARNVNLHGRYADLIVLGQGEPEDPLSVSVGLADRVVLEAGRPVLVVPYIDVKPVGERVMVAWNATRESVRAVTDALPILALAKKVEVVAVNPRAGSEGHGEIPSADICLHLARHGVKAEAHHVEASDIEVGDVLLSRASDEGVDLIVMGAYGHSRLRELVLGGATQHLLEHMTVPVLMSH